MLPPDLEISCDPDRVDVTLVHAFLSASYWGQGRSRETVERSIKHSLCFGAYAGGQQIAFARVITDRAVFGYLADVFKDVRRPSRPRAHHRSRAAGAAFPASLTR